MGKQWPDWVPDIWLIEAQQVEVILIIHNFGLLNIGHATCECTDECLLGQVDNVAHASK